MDSHPTRLRLHHDVPPWVKDGSLYFVTFCTEPRGQNQLCHPDTAAKILKSAAYYHDTQRWWLKLFLLMPDHIHAMIAVPSEESLTTVVRMWKSYQTKNARIR